MGKKSQARREYRPTDWHPRAVPVLRDHLVAKHTAAANMLASTPGVAEFLATMDAVERRGAPMPDVNDQGMLHAARLVAFIQEYREDIDSLKQATLYWVSKEMGDLAGEYAGEATVFHPREEVPSDHGFLLFEDSPVRRTPFPSNFGISARGIEPTGNPDNPYVHSSWRNQEDLPADAPTAAMAAFRWSLRGDTIDVSLYQRRAEIIAALSDADERGVPCVPADLLVPTRELNWTLAKRGLSLRPDVAAAREEIPDRIRWMDLWVESPDRPEAALVEVDRVVLPADGALEPASSFKEAAYNAFGLTTNHEPFIAVIAGLLATTWTFINTPKLAAVSLSKPAIRGNPSPAQRKRIEAEGAVRVVTVKQFETRNDKQDGQGSGRKLTVRHLVRGHFRTFWTGHGRATPKRKFLAPYWRGDETMPVKEKPTTVHVLR